MEMEQLQSAIDVISNFVGMPQFDWVRSFNETQAWNGT